MPVCCYCIAMFASMKNQLCDNMIDNDFEDSVDATVDEVIMTKTKMHEITKRSTSFVELLCFFVLCLLCLCARLFICALWSPAGKGLTFWLSFVVYNCEFINFPFVSWVRCGT